MKHSSSPGDDSKEPSLMLTRRELLRLGGLSLLTPLLLPGLSLACSWRRNPDRRRHPYQNYHGYPETIADAKTAIADYLDTGPASAISVALIDQHGIIWAEAFGSLGIDWRHRPASPSTDTLFALGSGSKMFTAIATMILVDKWGVDLDLPLTKYLTDFHMADGQVYDDITVRMLVDHSSGFPGTDYRNSETVIPIPGYAEQVQETLSSKYLKHKPGTRAMYCNDGFTMIELLVEAVTGQAYTDFVTNEILRPLGMYRTRFQLSPLRAGTFAPPLDDDGRAMSQEFMNIPGAGGLYSTPTEMSRVTMMLLNGGRLPNGRRFLSEWAIEQMEMGAIYQADISLSRYTGFDDNGFGLGWDGPTARGFRYQFDGENVRVNVWHKEGDTTFYHSKFFVAHEKNLAVMVMDVQGFVSPILAERILLHALAEDHIIDSVPDPLVFDPNDVQSTPAGTDLSVFEGYYASEAVLFHLKAEKDSEKDLSMTLLWFIEGVWKTYASGLQLQSFGDNADWLVTADDPGDAYRVMTAEELKREGVMTEQDLALDWDGRRYLLWRTPGGFGHYRYDSLLGQEVQARPAGDLPDGWQARSDPETNWQYRSWLLVNDSDSVRLTLGEESPLFTLTQAPGVFGFLVVENGEFNFIQDPSISDDRAGMYLGYTRDINDLFVETREGEEWLLWGSNLYRPLWTVPELVDRWNRVEIGDDGLGEWRKVSSVEAVSIAGASIWYLFNEDLSELSWGQGDGITKTFDGGDNYLLVQGKAGQLIRVRFGGALGLVHKHKRVPIRRRPSRRSFMHSTWNRWR